MRGGERHHRNGRIEIRLPRGVEADRAVRVEHFAAVLPRPAHRLRGLCRISPRAGEQTRRTVALGIGEPHRLRRFEAAHLLRQRRAVAAADVEQQPLEIGTDLDVHARRGGRRDGTGGIVTVGQRAVEDVVDVRRHDQALDRQPHPRRDVAREDVAEIARRHAEGDLLRGPAQLQRGGEIIHHLRHQTCPVDRVNRADAEAPPARRRHRRVGEHPLHHRLRVVEAAVDGDVVDVGGEHGGHLPPLHVADPPLGMEHEDVDPLAPRHRVDRRAAGIAAGRADDGQVLVAAREEFLEQQAKQLQRDILEGERRSVEQFEHPMPLVELDQRRDRVVRETTIGRLAQFAQPRRCDAVADEGLHHPRCEFGIGQTAQRTDLVFRKARPFARQVQPAIARQPGQRHAFEIERRGSAAGGDVFHRERRLAMGGRGRKQWGLGPAKHPPLPARFRAHPPIPSSAASAPQRQLPRAARSTVRGSPGSASRRDG